QTITVRDNTPPTISAAGGNRTTNCHPEWMSAVPTATHTCDPSPAIVVVSDVTTPGTCAGTYSETKTWKAVDACNNSSGTVSQTITVRDNTPPTATKGSIGACYQTVTAANQAALDATTALNDTCDASPSKAVQTSGTASTSYKFTTVGVYMVTNSVTDACGNTGTSSTVGGSPAMVVIYDPNGGFVTGGGWFMSPIVNPTLYPNLVQYMSVSGKAN